MPITASIPALFLLVSVASAMFTLNALWPARRFWPLVGAGFFASWLTGELATHHLFWQAAATGLFVWAGGLDEWPSMAALVIFSLSWMGLLRILVQSRQANEVMETALREGLGADYERLIPERFRDGLTERWTLRQRLFPLPIFDGRVERIKNIVFSKAGGVDLRLDVCRPKGLAQNELRPTVLFVHGGGWTIGSKDDQGKPLANRLAAHGWVVVSANYRLSPRFTFPDHIIDVKSAIRWIREHGEEYGANPDFVVITGGSAGGHLAALAALTPNDPTFQPGFEHVDTSVQGCVPFYGVYDFTDRKAIFKNTLLIPILEKAVVKKRLSEARSVFEHASPMSHVRADAPPFFVIHGEKDSLVPVGEGRLFVELLREKSTSPVLYAELPGAQHAFEVFPSERTGHVLAGVERFVGAVYGQWCAGREREVETRAAAG
ncbi:MAG: alpha/beta hydrolase [Polyangiaceae bacterium]|nr:alpha/beta hydrolase [Polyangiaceae bacterium]